MLFVIKEKIKSLAALFKMVCGIEDFCGNV